MKEYLQEDFEYTELLTESVVQLQCLTSAVGTLPVLLKRSSLGHEVAVTVVS